MASKLNPEQLQTAVSDIVRAAHTEPLEIFQNLARTVMSSETKMPVLDQVIEACKNAEEGYNTLLEGKTSTINTLKGTAGLAEYLEKAQVGEVTKGDFSYQAPKVEGKW